MKVVILAGGYGSRLSEYTENVPKPMVNVGDKPILWHIMKTYAKFGFKDFYIALGYKSEVIKDYFYNYKIINSDFTIDLSDGKVTSYDHDSVDWRVNLIDTGLNSMTGGRIKHMQNHIGNETFLLTYGDAVADINIDELIKFHKNHKKMVTVTAVRPNARFGELEINNNVVTSFREKPQITEGWISGGYFVVEPEIFNFIKDLDTVLEKSPLETISEMSELIAFKHEGFWQCMDTKRDKELLDKLWIANKAPWK